MRNLRSGSDQPDITPEASAGAVAPAEAERAFAAEFARLLSGARTYARRRVGSLWADDIVQDAFMDLWEATYAQGRLPKGKPEQLFYRILRRRIVDHRRSQQVHEALDDQHSIDLTHVLEPRLEAARVADGNLLAGRINYLLEAMPATTAQVFRAVWQNDWDVRAAAKELNIPYDTTRGHFLRAKHRLAESLGADGYSIPKLIPRGRDGGRKQ